VLVTDHHLPGEELPRAEVIVNPNQRGCAFASKSLAGVGVMFYVLSALRAELRQRGWFSTEGITEPNLGDALDLVALGTVADVVPLDRNNRILVAAGLARIRRWPSATGYRGALRGGRAAITDRRLPQTLGSLSVPVSMRPVGSMICRLASSACLRSPQWRRGSVLKRCTG
jgi:single-stranded-DNA-specific exonuclease